MHYRKLGKTGLKVSLLGLGTGGARQMGRTLGHTRETQHALVQRCLDLGVNLFDTSEGYNDSEEVLGDALNGVLRDSYVLVTKWSYDKGDKWAKNAGELRKSVEQSLSRLRTEYLDVLMLHGVRPDHYHEVVERYAPELSRLKDEGLARHIGFSERFHMDTSHQVVVMGLNYHPELWDVVEFKYGILNQLATRKSFPLTQQHNVGVINMAAVRVRLPDPVLLEETVAEWKKAGYLAEDSLSDKRPLDWLIHDGVDSVVSAGYKFAVDHPAVSTVLSGTSSIDHLEENAIALEVPKLPKEDTRRLVNLFGDVDEYA